MNEIDLNLENPFAQEKTAKEEFFEMEKIQQMENDRLEDFYN